MGLRFAQAGASVYIIGRNATLGQKAVEEMRLQSGPTNSEKTFEFIQADLRSVNRSTPRNATDELRSQVSSPESTMRRRN